MLIANQNTCCKVYLTIHSMPLMYLNFGGKINIKSSKQGIQI